MPEDGPQPTNVNPEVPPQPQIVQPTEVPAPEPEVVTPVEPSTTSPTEPVAAATPEPTVMPAAWTNPPALGQPVGPSIATVPKRSRKRLLLIVGVALLLVLLGGGYVFGYYLPNKPENIWATGLSRSNKAVKELVKQATDQKTLDAYKKSDMTIGLTAKTPDGDYSGQLGTQFDSSKGTGALSVTSKQSGQADKVLTAKFMGELKQGSQYPDIYFQFNGLKSFGLDTISPVLNGYENKWISVQESYFKSLNITPQQLRVTEQKQVTSEDVSEAIRTVTDVSNDYLLTTNPQKAVFERRKYVGKEQVDGRTAYHYVVGINKQHAKDYCTALTDKVMGTQVYRKLGATDQTGAKDSLTKECQKSTDGIKDSDTFDMWIDAKYKLIYKVRITDDQNKQAYVDIGQTYTGGDDIAFFANYHDDKAKSDTKINLGTNMKTHVSKGSLQLTETGDSAVDVKVTIDAKPFTGDIKVEKPANATPIQDVLKALGLNF